MQRTRKSAILASAAAVLLLLAGCAGTGSGSAPSSSAAPSKTLTPLQFQLNFAVGGIHSGFAVAVDDGFYKKAGLDVTLVPGNGSVTTAQLLASNQVQIGYADAAVAAQIASKGAAIRTVSTIYGASPYAVIALKAKKVTSPKDLKGLKVGVPSGATQSAIFPTFLKVNKLSESDVSELNLPNASLVPALLQGQVDAIIGSTDSFGPQLQAQGAKIDVLNFSDFGVPLISQGIVASDRFLVDKPAIAKAFIAASLEGFASAKKDPENAVTALKHVFPQLSSDASLRAEVDATNALLCGPDSKYIGKPAADSWTTLQSILSTANLLPADGDVGNFYSNAYLPADSKLTACPSK